MKISFRKIRRLRKAIRFVRWMNKTAIDGISYGVNRKTLKVYLDFETRYDRWR